MIELRDRFHALAGRLFDTLSDSEVLLIAMDGEDSDFVRFNKGRIRHAGHVRQAQVRLDLISGSRRARATLRIGDDVDEDAARGIAMLRRLRDQLPHLPEDPYVLYAASPRNTEHHLPDRLPSPADAVTALLDSAEGLDLVGSWAAGRTAYGFANSLGQRNWYSDFSFTADWSVYGEGERAVKQDYAGSEFSLEHVSSQIVYARETLAQLGAPPKHIDPGRYRVFLAPAALYELLEVVGRTGFGLKSHRTAQTPLLGMVRADRRLSHAVSLVEHHESGREAPFTLSGFIKPARVELITDGIYQSCLANARSAKEYGVAVNCTVEHPRSLWMEAGDLHQDHVLERLGTGLFISNLWYCNLSDPNNCRITGLTRFACLWVESGRIVGPVDVMRFDESLFSVLGSGLEGITQEREYIFDTTTYGRRSVATAQLPGVLVDGFRFTL